MTKAEAIAKSIKQAQENTPSSLFSHFSARHAAEAMYEIMNDKLTAALVGWKVDMGRAREAEKEAGDYRKALEEAEARLVNGDVSPTGIDIIRIALGKLPQPEGRSIDQMDF